MAAEPLSDELKAAGKAMVAELDAIGLEPQGVLWLYFHGLQDWRFTVISALVDPLGRRKVYTLIDEALSKLERHDGLTMLDIHLCAPGEIIPRLIGGAIRVDDGSVTMTDCIFNGLAVDALVYRVRDTPPPADIARLAKRFPKAVRQLLAA